MNEERFGAFKFWVLNLDFRTALSGFFLIKKSLKRIYRIRWILPFRFGRSGCGTAAETAEFGFEEIGSDAADIRNKFRLGRGALNLKWNLQPATGAAPAAATAAANLSKEPAKRSGCATRHGS